jgi:acyl carrier protein
MTLETTTLYTLRLHLRPFYAAGLTFEQVASLITNIEIEGKRLTCTRVAHGPFVDVPFSPHSLERAITWRIGDALNGALADRMASARIPNLRERVYAIIAEQLALDVVLGDTPVKDLGADSLDVVELEMAFEEEFGVEIPTYQFSITSTPQDFARWLRVNAPEDYA